MSTLARTISAAVLLSLATAPSAFADSFSLGPIESLREPIDVAVDGAGTAHVFHRVEGRVLRYCRLPRGARACASELRFDTRGGHGEGPQLAIGEPNRVVLVVPRDPSDPRDSGTASWLAISNDGGVTFAPLVESGLHVAEDVVLGPGNAVTGPKYSFSEAGALEFDYLQSPIAGGRSTLTNLGGTSAEPYANLAGKRVALAGGAPIFTWTTEFPGREPADARVVYANRWTGTGSLGDRSTWTGPFPISAGQDSTVTGGPSGVVATYGRANDPRSENSSAHIYSRKIEGTSAGPESIAAPYAVDASELGAANSVYGGTTQDASGRLTTVFARSRARPPRGRESEVANTITTATSTDGQRWTRAVNVCEPGTIRSPRAATAADGGGFAVYVHSKAPTTEVRAAPIGLGERTPACPVQPDGRLYDTGAGERKFLIRGRITIGLVCSDGHVACNGTGRLKLGRTTIATKRYAMEPGQSDIWRVRLSAAGRREVERRGRVRLTAVFSTRGARATTIPVNVRG